MKTKSTTFKIHFFASTGSFHRNGIVRKSGAKPTEEAATALARAAAEKFAAEKGQPLKEFSLRLIGK